MRKERIQISEIRNKKGEIKTNTKEVQEIIREYFEKLYLKKLDNQEEIDKFVDIYEHLKLNQNDINDLNQFITCNEIK
jgi:hypothetical protein